MPSEGTEAAQPGQTLPSLPMAAMCCGPAVAAQPAAPLWGFLLASRSNPLTSEHHEQAHGKALSRCLQLQMLLECTHGEDFRRGQWKRGRTATQMCLGELITPKGKERSLSSRLGEQDNPPSCTTRRGHRSAVSLPKL